MQLSIDLQEFLARWKSGYLDQIKQIKLFQKDQIKKLDKEKKIKFIKIFYHARGHFNDFLWLYANLTPSKEIKEIIINNISEELAPHGVSHEQLYLFFAEDLGVDLRNEVINQENYFGSIKEFNKSHLEYIWDNNENRRLSAFSAYELLDNIDYPNLLEVAKQITKTRKALIFFEVHINVEHFQPCQKILDNIWQHSKEDVLDGFTFISDNQIKMWTDLSKEIFS